MKKLLTIILISSFLLVGCQAYRIKDLQREEIINTILKEQSPKTNTALKGYKLYLPRDMKITSTVDSNSTIYSDRTKYFLYVDLVSYYNNIDQTYDLGDNNIFQKELYNNGHKGYVIVRKYDDKRYIEIMYNYAKIEVVTGKNNEKKVIANSLSLLKSITYNRVLIESIIGTEALNYSESTYQLVTPKTEKDTIEFVEQEYEDVDHELPDEDEITTDDDQTDK